MWELSQRAGPGGGIVRSGMPICPLQPMLALQERTSEAISAHLGRQFDAALFLGNLSKEDVWGGNQDAGTVTCTQRAKTGISGRVVVFEHRHHPLVH